MMPTHAFVVDDTVINVFHGLGKRDRDELIRIFDFLANNPNQTGDWRQKGLSGRDMQVKRFRKWLVTYWLDAPVLEIRIVDIKKVAP